MIVFVGRPEMEKEDYFYGTEGVYCYGCNQMQTLILYKLQTMTWSIRKCQQMTK